MNNKETLNSDASIADKAPTMTKGVEHETTGEMANKEILNSGVKIDDKATVVFISNGKAPTMPKGVEYEITGAMANIFISQNYGKVK